MSIERPVHESHSPPGSVNWFTNHLHHRRIEVDAKGQLLLLPRTGLVVVPHLRHPSGSWTCTVVSADWAGPKAASSYPRGGYDIDVSGPEIETAIEITDLHYSPIRDPHHPLYAEVKPVLDNWARLGVG